ncbi:MAG: methionine--tRNA ligase [Acidobacteria bacterium]|nr:methionine--tRNA ligase [Acidobacteriota bacterium]
MAKFYLTTPLYYVNAAPHLGHAYSTIVADTIRRYKNLQGLDAFLLTGTDEHGQKVERSAKLAGMSPQEFADQVAELFRKEWQDLGLEFDSFIRTTDAKHEVAVKKIFEAVWKAGYIFKGSYTGQYCTACEQYANEAKPGEPCPECGGPTETITEENYFFKLSAFQDRLLNYYEEHPEFIRPETRRNEVIAFVRSGLRDLSISRTTLKWGIPLPSLPGSSSEASQEKHVFYVWFDALTGYLSGIGYGQDESGEEPFRRLWPADLQIVGKEIIRFHAVYWPAFLMAAGLPIPHTLFAHGWLLFEEDKMSKSRGNVVSPGPVREVLGIDALRYFLLREIPFGQDGNFSFDALVSRYNSDLANDFGNLASRVLTMIGRYFNSEIPYPSVMAQRSAQDRHILELAENVISRYTAALDNYEFSGGLEAVWELIAAVNKYLVDTEPWALAEKNTGEDRSKLATVLYTSAEALRIATQLLSPIMPESTARIWTQLGQTTELSSLPLKSIKESPLATQEKIGKIEPVFPRLEKEATVRKLVQLQQQVSGRGLPKKTAAGVGAETALAIAKIAIEDFLKVELRVGEVRVAERVKGASKLLRLEVDIGTETRQIVAGIAESYAPETLIGRKVVIVANLQPRKLRGIESNGMIVAASVGKEDRPVLVTFIEDVPNGAKLR